MASKTESISIEETYKGSELIRSASGTQKDVLTVLLHPGKYYTLNRVEELTRQFLQKEVK